MPFFQNSNIAISGNFWMCNCRLRGQGGPILSYYQLNLLSLCLPEIRGSLYYVTGIVACHLCLLLSPLLIEFWCCINETDFSAYGSHCRDVCTGVYGYTHRTCHCKWKGSRKNIHIDTHTHTVDHTVHACLTEHV